jgi:hypothetical protein
MSLPNTYTDKNETGCCPVPNVDAWDKKEITFADQRFVRMYTRSFFYVPLNMGKIMTKLYDLVDKSDAALAMEQSMILSHDLSPWKAEQLYAVDKPIEGVDNVNLSGSFVTRVFEGPYKDAEKWHKEMISYAKEQGHEATTVYFFYTTCPKCAKHYGKNYVIGLAKIS